MTTLKRLVATISLIEWAVYGLIAYSSVLMLIISTIKEVPETKYSSITRSVFMIPGIICAGILASSGVDIQLNVDSTSSIMKDLNTTDTWQQTTTNTTNFVIQNPIWQTVHYAFMVILILYVIIQILNLLTKKN